MPDPAVMHGVLRHLRRTERRRLYHLLGDRELLARFLAERDETAFEELVTRHGPMVRAVCRRVLGPTADADDAFQAAFLVFLRRARSIQKADLLAGWLCAVAYRTARQALRRRSLRGVRERGLDDLPDPARPDDPPRDWLPLFDAALQRLPAKYRDPVVLCELQGVSRRDASVRLGLSEGTLSSRLGRARDLLRRKLAPVGFPLAVGSALAPAVVPEALTASTVATSVHVSAASVSAVVLTEGVLAAMFASKLKAGALAGTAVLAVGIIAGFQFTGPVSGAGGPPGKDGSPAKEAAKSAPPLTKADPRPARLAAEYEPFQGDWVMTAAERDGSAQPVHAVGMDENWTFRGNTLTTGGEAKSDVTDEFTLDPRAKPSTIDFTLTQFSPDGTGALVRTPYQGIYRFDLDGRLEICFRKKGGNILRPTRFATAHNSGATVVSLRRPEIAKDVQPPSDDVSVPDGGKILLPAAKVDPSKNADLGKVVGAWELADVDGLTPDAAAAKLDARPQPAGTPRSKQRWEKLRRLQLLAAIGPTDLVNQPGALSCVAYVDLDGARNPKWFTLFVTERSQPAGAEAPAVTLEIRLCGIYRLDGEKLVIGLPEEQGPPLLRPTDFAGDGEGGLYLLTYQRPAKNWKPNVRLSPNPVPDPPARAPADGAILPPRAEVPGPVANPHTVSLPDGPVGPHSAPPVGGPPPVAPTSNLPVVPVGGPPPAFDSGPLLSSGLVDPAVPAGLSPVAGDAVPSPAPASDLDRLQGTWVLTQMDGREPGPEQKPSSALEFLKDRILIGGGHGRIRLDEAKSPRQITIATGVDAPQTGIYKLEGDRLTIATSMKSNKLIPLGFEPDPEAGVSVAVYERPKPPSAPPPSTTPKTDPPTKSPPRDLQKEIDQLREQLKRLEKELNDRKE